MTHAVPCCVSSLKVGSKVYWSISLSSAFVKCRLSMLGLHSRVRAEVKWNEVKSSQKYLAIMNLCKRRVVICFRCAFPPLFLMYSRTLVSFETLNKMEKHKVMKKLVLFFLEAIEYKLHHDFFVGQRTPPVQNWWRWMTHVVQSHQTVFYCCTFTM